jgi:putative ABC transport system ATP-binding protein
MNIVEVKGLTKHYRLGGGQVRALDDVNLTVTEGEFLALSGPSGSGKSTLLNMIGCIDIPDTGWVSIDGREVAARDPDQLAHLRATSIGFVFQTFNLLPVLTAAENVEYPLLNQRSIDKPERRRRVRHFLEVVGLERFAHHRPNEMSGGQRQRVAIDRALATHPRIVLADEPTANLDQRTGASMLELMKQINERSKTTFIFSTHDPQIMGMADRCVHLRDGRVVPDAA